MRRNGPGASGCVMASFSWAAFCHSLVVRRGRKVTERLRVYRAASPRRLQNNRWIAAAASLAARVPLKISLFFHFPLHLFHILLQYIVRDHALSFTYVPLNLLPRPRINTYVSREQARRYVSDYNHGGYSQS